MPFIETKTNVKITDASADAIKTRLGKAIETLPGKSERWLMVSFAGEQSLYFQGSDAPCAISEVKIYGSASADALEKMTAKICSILSGELGIPEDRIYVKYELCQHWGWNGGNF